MKAKKLSLLNEIYRSKKTSRPMFVLKVLWGYLFNVVFWKKRLKAKLMCVGLIYK